jgi:hypothetical protein
MGECADDETEKMKLQGSAQIQRHNLKEPHKVELFKGIAFFHNDINANIFTVPFLEASHISRLAPKTWTCFPCVLFKTWMESETK